MLKKNVFLLLRLIQTFGFITACKIFFNLKFKSKPLLRIPNAKYPVELRRNSSDLIVFEQVFFYKEYNLPLASQPTVIIDAGANIGLFTVKMKMQYPDAKIICIEPDPENFALLKKNVKDYDDVFCENRGLWYKDTKLKVSDKFGKGKWAVSVEEDNDNGNIDAISLNTLLKKYSLDHIDVLKLDIETSEKYLFTHNFEEWLPKVKTIVIEFHDNSEKGTAMPFFRAINQYFKDYSYALRGENTIITNESI